MEGITTFNSKALMEAYINTTNTTSHVLEELLVYLLTAKLEYLFLVHGWYIISSNITLDPLAGANSLLKVAKLQVINLNTKELNTYIPTNALILEPGIYRIDYGIYRNLDGSWSIENIILNPYIKFILIDSKVTKIGDAFPYNCNNLNGTLFTSLEDNSDILLDIDEQFITETPGLVDLTLSKIESHIVNSTLYMFGNRCPNLGNLDFIDNNNIKTLTHPFRACWTSNKSIIYANTKLSSANFRYLDKILEVVIPEENPNLVWDSNINSICKKTLYNGYKEIVTGGGSIST